MATRKKGPAAGSPDATDAGVAEEIEPAAVAEEIEPAAVAEEIEPAAVAEEIQQSQPAEAPDRPGSGATGWAVLRSAARPRATRGQLIAALLCGLLGFALVTQVHSQANNGLANARQADLVDLLDSLSGKAAQLQSQINDQQNALSRLTGGTDQTQAALEEAQQRLDTLRILAGTIAATGPGIDLHIDDPGDKVTADVLLDTLEELRDAGAEAVEITGGTGDQGSATATATPTGRAGGSAAVRLVASSYFVDSPDGTGVVVDGAPLSPPYDVLAIGDSRTMAEAMRIPGGVIDTLKSKGAKGVVSSLDVVRITALHPATQPQYARPAPSATP